MEDELFNIVINPNDQFGGLVLGSFTRDELRDEIQNVIDNILPKVKDGYDGLEIIRCVKSKDAEDAEK